MYTTNHYLMDTHTATGYHVLKEYREKTGDETKTILLSTASAYKFPESVYYAITDEMKNEYEAIDCLYDLTKINVPAPLLNMQDRPVLHTRTIEKDAIIDDIENSLVK